MKWSLKLNVGFMCMDWMRAANAGSKCGQQMRAANAGPPRLDGARHALQDITTRLLACEQQQQPGRIMQRRLASFFTICSCPPNNAGGVGWRAGSFLPFGGCL